MEKIIEIKADKGLLGGLFPSTEKTSGPLWDDGQNIIFRDLGIEQGLGRERILTGLSRAPKVMVQAFAEDEPRLYFEDNGSVYFWNGSTSNFIGTLDSAGNFDLEPFGTWLLATDDVNPLKLWKNTLTFASVGTGEFTKAGIIRKFQQYVLAYGTDTFPSGFHWCNTDDPEVWTPAANNRAGNLVIRELDSLIKAVAILGQSHAVYSQESMALVNYVGGQNVFGYRMALAGIGAVSKRSIIEYNRQNYGLTRAGAFITDGTRFEYFDRPAFNKWFRDNIDWTQGNTVFGYNDEQLGLLVWSVPLVGGGFMRLGFDPIRKTFTKLSGDYTAGAEKQVFSYPFLADSGGIYYASKSDEEAPATTLTSKPLDAGVPHNYKQWDQIFIEGTIGGLMMRIGYSDSERATPSWTSWRQVERNNSFVPRESVYMTMDFKSAEGADYWKISGITVMGNVAGFVA